MFEPEGRVWAELTLPLWDNSFAGRGRYYIIKQVKHPPLGIPLQIPYFQLNKINQQWKTVTSNQRSQEV